MLLKTNILIAIMLLVCILSTAQEQTKNKSAKIYSNLSLSSQSVIMDPETQVNNTTLRTYFTPAFAFYTKDGDFHEVELTNVRLDNNRREVVVIDSNGLGRFAFGSYTNFYFSFKYEYNFRLFKAQEEKPLRTYVGFGINPIYNYSRHVPDNTLSFPRFGHTAMADIYLVTRLNYYLSDRLFLDLNIPFNLASGGINSVKVENPAWPVQQRTTTNTFAETFPMDFMVRLGLGVRI